ncbi:ligand-dependent corepressor-like [Thalassophryne amazonica]|uniref:ligand-dependent corepressor-like n=1 Tax=Thalassophryne amazonica TaxID=390379 RepID=UPI0014716EE0|nr:ligand-dependent corepressor-like [Thalassophryne amazonica]
MCKLCLHPVSFHSIRRSLRADGQVGLFMKSLQDGRMKEDVSHSTHYKPSPSIAYSLHVKEEVSLVQESDPEPSLSCHLSSVPTDLRNGSVSCSSKSHFGTQFKLRTNSEATEHLKDIPRLLDAAGLIALSSSKRNCFTCSSSGLKIPQVQVLSTSTGQSVEFSGSLCENSAVKKLHHGQPKQVQKKSSAVFDGSGVEKEYWPSDPDCQASGKNFSTLHSEMELGNKPPRKKRGRYRQYNTQLLEEAIVVVMDGKMSVSKAQSIYGIPHSTLEYKVKERLGTLKHPPKKKLRVLHQVEEQCGSCSTESNRLQNSQHKVSE